MTFLGSTGGKTGVSPRTPRIWIIIAIILSIIIGTIIVFAGLVLNQARRKRNNRLEDGDRGDDGDHEDAE